MTSETFPSPRVLLVSSTLPGVLRRRLTDAGVDVIDEVLLGARLSELVHRLEPDVVVFDSPRDDSDVLSAAVVVGELWPGVALLAQRPSDGLLELVNAPHLPGSPHYRTESSRGSSAVVKALESSSPAAKPRVAESGVRLPVSAVGIGCSTGGPSALEEVLSRLPATFPAPIVVVQHMPAEFTGLFAQRLDRSVPLRVVEGSDGDTMRSGTVYVAPGDRHLEVTPYGLLVVHDEPAVSSARPSVDILFASLARSFPAAAVSVLLSGMGDDGVEGARQVVESGGSLVCQDEATSVVWGMPGAAVRAGIACTVLPVTSIASALTDLVGPCRA